MLSPITAQAPNLTIDGSNAPNGGICTVDYPFVIATRDVIIRNMRFRPGAVGGETDALQINNPACDVLIEHCSLSWGVDEVLDIFGDVHDIEIAWCIISEGLLNAGHSKGAHSMGILCGGGETNVVIHHCLLAHNNQRNPTIQGGRVDFIENVVYNYGDVNAFLNNANADAQINYINNYFKRGPSSAIDDLRVFIQDYDNGNTLQVYMDGNTLEGSENEDWDLVRAPADDPTNPLDHKADVPFAMLKNIQTGYTVEQILDNVGAILPKRDAVDARVVADVRNGTGAIIDDPSEVGGWPDLTL